MEHIRSELKTIRESAGLSQDELADAIGVNRKTIISIESDNGADPKLSTIRRIMAYLKIPFEVFIVQLKYQKLQRTIPKVA